jgi:DNA-binding CsgD family transcriptional regulator/N-acetylneuraminic acid mutarotase
MAEPNEALTERELEVVRLVGVGITNKEIAQQLNVSANTVRVHLNNIFTKLGVHSRTELTVLAIRNGWVLQDNFTATTQNTSDAETSSGHMVNDNTLSYDDNLVTGNTTLTIQTETSAIADNASRVVFPKVAPNPQPLPPLALWRRFTLVIALAVGIALFALSFPISRLTISANPDGIGLSSNIDNSFLSPGETTRWFQRSALPNQRARAAAVTVGNSIYVIGGEINKIATSDLLSFDKESNTWRNLSANKPTPVGNAIASVIGDIIYVVGGTTLNDALTSRNESFDIQQQSWRTLAPLPRATAGHAMAAYADKLYVFGGKTSIGTTANSFVYNPQTDAWIAIAPMPTPRSLAAAVANDTHIFVIGGYDDGRESSICEAYNPIDNEWSVCAPMLLPRGGFGLVRFGANIYAIGGGWSGFVGFNERYDIATNRWSAIETPLIGDWRSVAVAASNTEFYVIGGYSNNRRLATTYVYEVFNNRTYLPDLKQQQKND